MFADILPGSGHPYEEEKEINMASLNAALNNLKKNQKVTRKAWPKGSHLKMVNENIIRVKSNGNESNARLVSDDILATDYGVFKKKDIVS